MLDERVKQRRANYDFYYKNIKNSGISFLPEIDDCFSNRWITTILVDSIKTGGISTIDIRLWLEKHDVETRPLWKPMHLQPVFKQYPFYGDHTSEKLFEKGLCLPSGSNLSAEDRSRILKCFKSVFNNE